MERRIYRIPTNYRDSGYIFNGQIAKRNAVDAAVLGFIGYMIANLLPLQGEMALSGYVLFIGLFAMIGIVGFQQIPISVYLADMIQWRKRRKKPYFYNDNGGAYTVSAADLLINEPQLRDILANAIDSVRNSMAAKRPEYIEGETFEFMVDPELEALQAAQERMLEEAAEKAAKFDKDQFPESTPNNTAAEANEAPKPKAESDNEWSAPDIPSPTSAQQKKAPAQIDESSVAPMGSVNIKNLLNSIRLNEIEEGVIDDG